MGVQVHPPQVAVAHLISVEGRYREIAAVEQVLESAMMWVIQGSPDSLSRGVQY